MNKNFMTLDEYYFTEIFNITYNKNNKKIIKQLENKMSFIEKMSNDYRSVFVKIAISDENRILFNFFNPIVDYNKLNINIINTILYCSLFIKIFNKNDYYYNCIKRKIDVRVLDKEHKKALLDFAKETNNKNAVKCLNTIFKER